MKQQLLSLWPSAEQIDECIKSEAEAFDEAAFLAVHQSMQFRHVLVGSVDQRGSVKSEQDLLSAFLTSDLPEGRLIVPIIGNSGVGKSHVIKWLDARLRRRPDAARRHIIRIPKGASLKSVLRLLLQGLEGPKYDAFRDALSRARDQLDPQLAAMYLRDNLAAELEKASQQAAQRIRTKSTINVEFDKFLRTYGQRRHLPAFIGDPELWDKHFYGAPSDNHPGGQGPIGRLAQHVTQEGGSDVDNRKHQFEPGDLRLPPSIRITDLNVGAREFYSLLETEDDQRREVAARVLNHVLDSAKSALLDLGSTSLGELFAEVRASLLEDGKELVLLVEDFAVLSGLQGALLDVMIREAVRDGTQVLCTMRTALAYTSGYLPPDTMLTRAGNEWWIDDAPGREDDILQRIERLVAAYVNAARVGGDALRSELRVRASAEDLERWIPTKELEGAEEDVARIAEAFGRSQQKYLLFPFNAASIRQLSREGVTARGQLIWNPREVINNVIKKVLGTREIFAAGQFPPTALGMQTLRSASLIEEVKARAQPAVRERYLKLLGYWGDQPGTIEEASRLPREIYEAFDLPPLDFGEPEPSRRVHPDRVRPPPAAAPLRRDPYLETWQPLLEQWQGGALIPQAEANQLRHWIAEAIVSSLPDDWPGWVRATPADLIGKVYLPGARGSGMLKPEDAMVVLCSEDARRDPSQSAPIQLALESVIRFRDAEGSLHGPRTEELIARYAAFVSHHRPRAIQWLRSRLLTGSTPGSAIPVLVQGLLVGARALNLKDVARPGLSTAIQSLFVPADSMYVPEAGRSDEWEEVRRLLHGMRTSGIDSWVNNLLSCVGARQGAGSAVHAVDVTLLKEPIEHFLASWNLDAELPNVTECSKIRALYQELRRRLPKAVKERANQIRKWRSDMVSELGEQIDKESFVSDLREFLTETNAQGLADADSLRSIRDVASEFQKSAIAEAMDDAARLKADAINGTVLSLLGKNHAPAMRYSASLLSLLATFFDQVERSIESERTRIGADVAGEAFDRLRKEISAAQGLVGDLERSHS